MVSYIVGLSPKLILQDGNFIFTEEEARKVIAEMRAKYPRVEFHLSEGGKIVEEKQNLG